MENISPARTVILAAALSLSALVFSSCGSRSDNSGHSDTASEVAVVDTLSQQDALNFEAPVDTAPQVINVDLDTELLKPEYADGILPVIARASRSYAKKILENPDNARGFIVVDKRRMKVILYDRYGHEIRSVGMACARNFGTKHKKADSRTPEGYFTVIGIFDSTEWLFTNDDGYTSPAKGSFGPRFIRLSVPQIGIHGTSSPGSIGRRASHGCIRVTNDNIMELVELVDKGMSVIIIPGERDQAVNKKEGSPTVSFLTAPDHGDQDAAALMRKNRPDSTEIKPDTLPHIDSLPGVDSLPKTDSLPPVDSLPVPPAQSAPSDSLTTSKPVL